MLIDLQAKSQKKKEAMGRTTPILLYKTLDIQIWSLVYIPSLLKKISKLVLTSSPRKTHATSLKERVGGAHDLITQENSCSGWGLRAVGRGPTLSCWFPLFMILFFSSFTMAWRWDLGPSLKPEPNSDPFNFSGPNKAYWIIHVTSFIWDFRTYKTSIMFVS